MLQALSDRSDDRFQPYDLHVRVEVVCPPNGRILCSVKPGDYFTRGNAASPSRPRFLHLVNATTLYFELQKDGAGWRYTTNHFAQA
ncbi:hypothetical protein L210DRAFT_584037 [Boletus edulis BED1]|uniref:Uncharacterized protein n=1 Tax=Boletus edulis BED1 TaxID=1328754 RepID=A0AAD4GLL2_BOLED|nr:hypothetical protein L210DRAFT_584037 [Boletus edulis BED1]